MCLVSQDQCNSLTKCVELMSALRHILITALAFIVWQVYDKNFNTTSVRPRVEGYFHPAFRKVAEAFRTNVENGLEKGAAFAAYHKGELLVDLWGGWADMAAERHWQEDTLCMIWSVVKGAAAIAVARLVDM
ncbi:beta-lactamase domain-containing protein 2 [Plakobranchus ocellatus]|uniref:Beta-lactamase domain-containing protein 2 n=1 Tax=Plakobranchus ocellatus TaxID=259542 RepID=A0AAV4BVM7_9GAST|nr:beta-lactamase domain-containing protein 2 [Plakobranchus ocellatus]